MAEYILRTFGLEGEPCTFQTDSEETLTNVLFNVARLAAQSTVFDPTRVLTDAIALAMAQKVPVTAEDEDEDEDGEQAHG